MSVFSQDHLDGTNGVAISTSNTTFTGLTASSATAVFDTSVHAAGTSSMKCVQTASFGSYVAAFVDLVTPTTTGYSRWCFQISAVPNGNFYIAQKLTSPGAVVARVAINGSGKLAVYNGTTLASTGTTTLAISTLYRIEWDMVGTTSTVRLYGSPTSTTILETITTTVAGTSWVRNAFGIAASANSNLLTMWVDEIVLDNATTPGPVGASASSSGSLAFGSHSTSANGATTAGSAAFSGSSTPSTFGGSISGFADTFSTTAPDPTKWIAVGTTTKTVGYYGAPVGATNPQSSLTSVQFWDATATQFFVAFSPPASGTGDTMVTLINSLDSSKYAQLKVSAGILTMTFVNGGADGGIVTRAVTADDNVVRFTEASGNVTVEVRKRGLTTWSTLRTFTTPTWWNTVRVQLSAFSASPTGTFAVFSDLNNLPATPTGHLLLSTLLDDFAGPTLDATKWTTAGPGVVKVTGVVEVDASTVAATDIISTNTYVLDSASILMTPAHNSSLDDTTLKLLSPTPGTEARITAKNGNLVAEYRIAGISDGYEVSTAHDNTQPVWVALAADQINGNLVWSFSIDGSNFAVLRTQSLPLWFSGVQVAFGSRAH